MSEERDSHRYFHAEHCGVNFDVKTTGTAEAQTRAKTLTEAPCAACGTTVPVTEVSRFEHERYTALEDDCENCGDVIVFLPDLLEWRHHEGLEVSVAEPVYGIKSCEEAMVRLMGLPAGTPMAEYAGKVASPAGTQVKLDVNSGEEIATAEAAIEAEREANFEQIKKRQTKKDVSDALSKFLRTVD